MANTDAAAAEKSHRQKLSLHPKKSIGKIENKGEKKKKKKKGAKYSVDRNKSNQKRKTEIETAVANVERNAVVHWSTASQQLKFFVHQYQSSNGVQLSSLELDSLKEARFLDIFLGQAQNNTDNLGEHVKAAFGSSWKEVLCEKHLLEGHIDPGSPALVVISSSALRSLELLRELRCLTKECHAAKLFSKHMKIEEQVSVLKNRVNIASGTPSRIKKLIDMEALGMSRLALILLDLHTDIKGYSLFTLPQVRDEFWDLYETYFHQRLLKGDLRLCLYGAVPTVSETKKKQAKEDQVDRILDGLNRSMQ